MLDDAFKTMMEDALREVLPGVVRAVVKDELGEALTKALRMPEGYMTVKEAADFVKVAPDTIRLWIEQKKLRGYHAGREWRLHPSDLRALLEGAGPRAANDDDLNELADQLLA